MTATTHEPILTDQQYYVLKLAAEGKPNKQIADALYVSKRTVDSHLQNIYWKLQVANRIEAINKARALGLLPHA